MNTATFSATEVILRSLGQDLSSTVSVCNQLPGSGSS